MDVAVTNESTTLSNADLAFVVEAVNAQVAECAAAYGVPFTPCSLYSTVDKLPAFEVRVATFVDDIPEAPGAAAFHSVDDSGNVYAKMRADSGSVGLSHEGLEELVDPECIKAATRPDGKVQDYEICDPCQGDTRKRQVVVLGETREIEESNYCLPNYWIAGSKGPWDAFGLMKGPFEIRPQGYAVIDGAEVFAEGDTVAADAVAARRADPGSRLNRRRSARMLPIPALPDLPNR